MNFIDLKKQYQQLRDEIDQGIQAVLDSGNYIMGPQVKDLEEKLAKYTGTKYCITCGNGTDALLLSLMAYGVKEGDAVFVPTFTFYASAEAVSLAGATPIFVDVDIDTFNMSPYDLKKAVQEEIEKGKLKPKAVMAVDLFGLPADYTGITDVCNEYNLLLIEDGAQGFGGSFNGKMACSFGDISTTSFFPAKPLGCFGDGGAIFTNEEKVKDFIESLRVHGKGTDKYDNVRIGMNSRLDTIQAAILLTKLKAFKAYELEARSKKAELYKNRLLESVITQHIPDGYASSYAQYSIRLKSRDQRDTVQSRLNETGIPSMIYYRIPLHQQTVYRNNASIYRGFPNAELISDTILSLPMDPYLDEDQINKITNEINKILSDQ